MKWVFRVTALIMLMFIGLCIAGYFMAATQTIERSIQVEAYPEDVFPYINDLQNYSAWSPLYAAIPDAQIIYGGADEGIGQSMVWQGSNGPFPQGSQEITQSQIGEFVQVAVNLAGRPATATHAILPSETGEFVTVLTKSEIELGGFPYLSRISAKFIQSDREAQFDESLKRLKTIVEAGISETP